MCLVGVGVGDCGRAPCDPLMPPLTHLPLTVPSLPPPEDHKLVPTAGPAAAGGRVKGLLSQPQQL